MEKFRSLNRYQKGVLLFLLLMVAVFSVLYPRAISRKGFAYEKSIFVPKTENGSTVYSGKLGKEQASFTVFEDKTVFFQYGDKTYGPYTAREDPSAIPGGTDANMVLTKVMTGVELRRGEEIIFRGGVADTGSGLWLKRADDGGQSSTDDAWWISGMDETLEAADNRVDPMEPSAQTILTLMGTPKLTHKGDGMVWFMGIFLCVLTALSIFFAEEMFRWNLSFQIRNVDRAEPSDWEIASRYIGWTLLPILILLLFVTGLQYKV